MTLQSPASKSAIADTPQISSNIAAFGEEIPLAFWQELRLRGMVGEGVPLASDEV